MASGLDLHRCKEVGKELQEDGDKILKLLETMAVHSIKPLPGGQV